MRGSQLALQAVGTEQRYPGDLVPQRPGLPHNPDIEVEQTRGVGQGGDDLLLHRNAVLIDLVIETLAERNTIFVSVCSRRGLVIGAIEPKLDTIKKMNPRPVENPRRGLCSLDPEKDASREDALEALHEASVMETILRQLQEFEHLGGAFEANRAASLFHRERGNPDGDEAVLTKWQKPKLGWATISWKTYHSGGDEPTGLREGDARGCGRARRAGHGRQFPASPVHVAFEPGRLYRVV
jgi:hypothetical protein